MKIEELYEAKKPGTYAGVRFSEDTKKQLAKYISDNDIPNPVPVDKLHTTVLYSTKHLPEYDPQGKIEPPYIGTPTGFEMWKTQPDDDGNTKECLILRYECSDLDKRHKALMKEHEATYSFDEYITHVTLSYDISDSDVTVKSLPNYKHDLEIGVEYSDDLNLDWAKTNTGAKT